MDEAETLEHHLGETITEPEKLKAHLDSKLSRKRERNDELKLQLKELRQQEFKINQSVNLLNSDLKKQTEEGEHLMNKYVDMNVKMAYLTAELEYRRSSLTEGAHQHVNIGPLLSYDLQSRKAAQAKQIIT